MNAFVHFIAVIIAHCESFVNIRRTVFRAGCTISENSTEFVRMSREKTMFFYNAAPNAHDISATIYNISAGHPQRKNPSAITQTGIKGEEEVPPAVFLYHNDLNLSAFIIPQQRVFFNEQFYHFHAQFLHNHAFTDSDKNSGSTGNDAVLLLSLSIKSFSLK